MSDSSVAGNMVLVWSERAFQLADSVVSRISAATLLVVASPVIAILFVLHKTVERDGGPFLYKGERIGKDWKRFYIYKIRTLKQNAEQQLDGALHKDGSGLELKMGRFLRSTRLDELPQLLNVIRGEMAFVGPRPVRQAVYEKECRFIPNYHERFKVLPGLTGLAQFMTPHGTPKYIRARINTILLRKMRNPLWRLYFVAWTAVAVARNVAVELIRLGTGLLAGEKDSRTRHPVGVRSRGADTDEETEFQQILQITDKDIHVLSERPLKDGEQLHIVMSAYRVSGRKRNRKMKQVRCHGVVEGRPSTACAGHEDNKPKSYIIQYKPVSDLHAYKLQRYVLKSTVM